MNQPAPDISICIANFNGGDLVLDCIRAVYAQSGDFTFEVIVHDDCSTEDSAERIEETFTAVQMIRGDVNRGFCVSNNRMAEAARGRYFLLLNNDALLQPGSLQRLFEFAEDGHSDCILGLPQNALDDGVLIDCGYRTDPFLNPIPMLESTSHEVGVATGACLWIPRSIWAAVGGFPTFFESVAEDIFMCVATRLLGNRVWVLDGPAFRHWVGRSLGGGKLVNGGLRTTIRRRQLSERNKTYTMLCCYPWPLLCALLPAHVSLLALEALFVAVTGPGPAKAWRIYGGLTMEILRHRKQLHHLRQHLMRQRRTRMSTLLQFTSWRPHKLTLLWRHGRPQLD